MFHLHDAAIQFQVPPEPSPGENFPGTNPFHQVTDRDPLWVVMYIILTVSGLVRLGLRCRVPDDGCDGTEYLGRLRTSSCHIRKPSGLFGAATHGIFPRSLADPTTPAIEHPKAIIPRHQGRKV